MLNKATIFIICIFFWISAQTLLSQTNEKWLPSSMEIYNDFTKNTVHFTVDYDSSNRIIGYLLSIEQNMESKKLTTYIKYSILYESDNRPTKLIKHNFDDEIIEEPKHFTVNYPEDNIIEIKSDTSYTAIIYLDSNNNLPIRLEAANNNGLYRSQMNITYEYKNQSLYKRIEEVFFETKIGSRNIDEDWDSDPVFVTSVFGYEADKKTPVEHIYPKWLSIYLGLDDIFTVPTTSYGNNNRADLLNNPDTNMNVYYNDDGFKTGWDTIDKEVGKEIHCKIEYIKAK